MFNTTRDAKERVTKILRMHADKVSSEEKEIQAGEIAAILGLQKTMTGDTLCGRGQPILLEPLTFVEPVVSVAIEPRHTADQAKLDEVLQKVADEDPTLHVSVNEETGQKIMSGMGELHLEIWIRRLLEEFRLDVRAGQPRVEYRETIDTRAEGSASFKKTVASVEHRGSIRVRVAPLERGAGIHVKGLSRLPSTLSNQSKALEDVIRGALGVGPLSAYPMVDIEVEVLEAGCADTDLALMALSSAASQACTLAIREAHPRLLEPFMALEVVTPEEFTGEMINDLNSRRGNILGMEIKGTQRILRAEAPLSKLFGYATDLRSMSQGRATYSMLLSHYGEAEVDWLPH